MESRWQVRRIRARRGQGSRIRADGHLAASANDPAELPIQYDLYRVPFNGGKGGTAEPIAGASANAMSNTFPKVSPDGRWIVFVKCRNGQLMRPDSQLYIVPARGGEARRMRANTPAHEFLAQLLSQRAMAGVFLQGRSPYTQMYLTHIDPDGTDSPAILVDNATAANRAVNLPEFVNIPPDGIEDIATPAVEMYKKFDHAMELSDHGQYEAAVGGMARIGSSPIPATPGSTITWGRRWPALAGWPRPFRNTRKRWS